MLTSYMINSLDDEEFMKEAIYEAEKGLGYTTPNPPVGAVIVFNGKIISKGYHKKSGCNHAEIEALNKISHNKDKLTLYVTLEPCSTQGETGPCTYAIIKAKISRVVIGIKDPNPANSGKGIKILREAGIKVTVGILKNESEYLIRFFKKKILTGLPWVIAKTAITLDGRSTIKNSETSWISSKESRLDVQKFRVQCDAIFIGGETFRRDNPRLTLRHGYELKKEQPFRVVITSNNNIPYSYNLLSDEFFNRSRFYINYDLESVILDLSKMEPINSIMIESGGKLLSYAISNNIVDEIILYVCPILGGGGNNLIAKENIISQIKNIKIKKIKDDIRVMGEFIK